MSDPVPGSQTPGSAAHDELQTALFLDLVAQHANMAMIFLGRMPHPQTGEQVRDMETARLFIDQLEMLEAKTRGNLNKHEEILLKQSLMATRMAFVESVEQPPAPANDQGSPSSAAPAAKTPLPTEASSQPEAEDHSGKKFSKKY